MEKVAVQTPRRRALVSGGISIAVHALIAGVCALVVVTAEMDAPEFLELNIGRLTQRQLARIMEQSLRPTSPGAPSERTRTPERRLPRVDMPAVSPTDVERRLLPDRVALTEEKHDIAPSRPASTGVPSIESMVASEQKAVFDGSQIDVGPRPGEGIESEHVGSDIQPVFLIEGELTGRSFHKAAITEVPDIPARTQVQLDVVVAPSGAIISAMVTRKENAALETFAVNYIRRSRFDPRSAGAPQENQTGRITITFAPGPR